MVVDILEIERCIRYFKAINSVELESIEWVRGAEKLQASPEELEEYRFCGLSNKDFPSVAGWMPEGVGIRVTGLLVSGKLNAEGPRPNYEKATSEN